MMLNTGRNLILLLLSFPSVQSPSEFLNKKPQPPALDRRQSIAVVEGLTNNRIVPSPTPAPTYTHPTPPHILERKCSLQVTGVGEGQSLVDAMSTRSSPGLSDMAMSNNRDALVRSVRHGITIFDDTFLEIHIHINYIWMLIMMGIYTIPNVELFCYANLLSCVA